MTGSMQTHKPLNMNENRIKSSSYHIEAPQQDEVQLFSIRGYPQHVKHRIKQGISFISGGYCICIENPILYIKRLARSARFFR